MSNNSAVIDKAYKEFENIILDTTEKELKTFCWNILEDAIRNRANSYGSHDFTGNLLNSIVVCLYRRRKPVIAYFSSSLVPEAIHPKMSIRKKAYLFKPDYSGIESKYVPTIQTDKGWGKDDAEMFFETYVPKGHNMFDIVVAYTVEYAQWVEFKRQTTGFLQTMQDAVRIGSTFMELKAA